MPKAVVGERFSSPCGDTGRMLLGILAAIFAALAYGMASVLQAHGAQSVTDTGAGPGEAPSLRSTIAAMLTLSLIHI